MTGETWVLLARLVRPQGRKGEIIADIFTDFPERFRERPRVFLRAPRAKAPSREALIEKHWLHQGRVVLKLKGIDSINDAETLRGMDVVVPAEERVPLAEDAVYISDLIGCQLLDGDSVVGQVEDVERGTAGAPDLLVVQPAKKTFGGPLLVPFARAYLVSIDLAARQIKMRLPAGLAELNAAAPEDEA